MTSSIWWTLLGYEDSEELRARRAIVHENTNEAQKSIGTARTLRRASDEAFRVAQCAVKLLEGRGEKDEAANRPYQRKSEQ